MDIKEYGEYGVLYKTYFLDKDSLIQGAYTVYHEDGVQLFEKSNYKNGVLEGDRIIYYENGIAEIREYYEAGVLSDTLFVFYPSGNIKRKEPYSKGVLNGIFTAYYENGQVKEIVSFTDDLENGPFTEYYETGHLMWQGAYLNGDNEFGELLKYDSSGTLIRKLMCDSIAICSTFWTLEEGEIN